MEAVVFSVMPHTACLRSQQSIRRPVAVSGIGYWGGQNNRVEINPALAGAGIVFVMKGQASAVRIPANLRHRVEASNRTNLSAAGVRVEMVEHLLSALSGLQIDCCQICVTSAEMPGLDGSAQGFVAAIDAAGIEDLGVPIDPLVVEQTVRVGDDSAWMEISPPQFAGLSVEYHLDYDFAPIGCQEFSLRLTPSFYRQHLAAARTFISVADADRLRAAGLGLAVEPRDLLVFGPEGLIDNTLRWPDECVRHKILDIVGDLALANRPIYGHVRAHRSGHSLNAALLDKLLQGHRQLASA